jgi:hypothetical protein
MKNTLLLGCGFAAALAIAACGTPADGAAELLVSEIAAEIPVEIPSGAPTAPAYRDVTIPSGTRLLLALSIAISSDTSRIEDEVSAQLTRPITIDGREVLPAGTRLAGAVVSVDRSEGGMDGAMIAIHFTSLHAGLEHYDVAAAAVSRHAAATNVRLGPGADVATRLTAPLTVRVRSS